MKMQRTKIEWCDYTCNCFWGCLEECSYCQARSLARRFGKRIGEKRGYNPEVIQKMREFKPVFLKDRLQMLYTIKNPSKIFMSFMGEPFCDDFYPYMPYAFQAIKDNPQHTIMMLTKQPQNLIKWSPFPDNCWLGVSVTNPEMFVEACYRLKRITAKVKFLSFEPLLNFEPRPDTLSWPLWILQWIRLGEVNWVIIGAQTPYSKKTAPRKEWVDEIVDATDKASIPVFLKENLRPVLKEVYGNMPMRQEMPNGKPTLLSLLPLK